MRERERERERERLPLFALISSSIHLEKKQEMPHSLLFLQVAISH